MYTEGCEQANYGLQTAGKVASLGQYIPPTKRQRLEQAKQQLEAGLAKVNAAIEVLDKYPDLEQFMNVIEQAGI